MATPEQTKPQEVAKEDANLATWPVTLATMRHQEGPYTFEGVNADGQPCSWTLSTLRELALPTARDEGVYVALAAMTYEQGRVDALPGEDTRVVFTFYRIAKKLGWSISGRNYQRIRESIERLHGVRIKAENSIKDPVTGRYGDGLFHILDTAVLYPEKAMDDQEALPFSWIEWSSQIRTDYLAGLVRTLDTRAYFSLENYTARTLFRYLDMRHHDGKPMVRIGFDKLGDRLGLVPPETSWRTADGKTKPAWYKDKLRKAHDELLATGFLQSVEYVGLRDGRAGVSYVFGDRPRAAADGTLGALIANGVNPNVARELVRTIPDEQIKQQLQWLPYRNPRQPVGMLVSAVRESWEPPKAWTLREEAEQRRQAMFLQRRQQRELDELEDEQHDEVEQKLAELSGQEREQLWAEARKRVGERMPKIPPDSPIVETAADHEVRLIVRERMERG